MIRKLINGLNKLNKRKSSEKGQVLPLVLILFFLGSFYIVTLLRFTDTGVKTGVVYQNKSDELYAADAGIEDGRWLIKYDYIGMRLTDPIYSEYDYSTNWSYQLANQVNNKDVTVNIKNVWIPKGVATPDPNEARAILESEKLVVTTSATETSGIITVTYYPGAGENLNVESLGAWLPRGYNYVTGSSNLEANPNAYYYSVPIVEPHAGNQAVTWTFNSANFTAFPGVNPQTSPMTTEISFDFTAAIPGGNPPIVAWITTSGVVDIPYSWDSDIKIFKIASRAGGTSVESYISREEIRRLRSAISGDYRAIGNSLMLDTNQDSHGVRDQLLTDSNATASDIPLDGEVAAALLYWSGWRDESSAQTIFSDTGSNLNNWNYGSSWTSSSGRFVGHYSSGGDPARYLTIKNSLDLTSNVTGLVTLSWDQSEGGTLEADDGLDFAISTDNGTSWSSNFQAFRDDIGSSATRYSYVIPSQYLSASFKVRFFLQGMSDSSEYAYIDNIAVTIMSPDTSVIFKMDGQQVYLDGSGNPQQGTEQIIADNWQLLPNYFGSSPHGFSYSAYKDVTKLVRRFSAKAPDPAPNHPGNGTYTVGDVLADTDDEISYAGWSLLIIYTSPATEGHQLYLYDKFLHAGGNSNIDFDNDGQPGGYISGFIVPNQIPGEVNAAKLTVFVGEGDDYYTGDFIAFNAPDSYQSHPMDIPDSYKLWDGTYSTIAPGSNTPSHPDNVWNGKSLSLTADGVDIDTFDITWASGMLQPGDTSARIDLPTEIDNWNVIYIMLSFRSETTTGGALTYRIQ